jgi:predicted ATPase
MEKTNFVILTGAPGSGKSTLVELIRSRGFKCIDEPARQILAEQRLIQSSGVPDQNPTLFVDLMLSRTTHQYRCVEHQSEKVIFFDRGIADNIAYAQLYGLSFEYGWNAARNYRFNDNVFFTPSWAEIYRPDEERKMSFEAAAAMGDNLRAIYDALGYTLFEIPLLPPEERADFLIDSLPENLVPYC